MEENNILTKNIENIESAEVGENQSDLTFDEYTKDISADEEKTE